MNPNTFLEIMQSALVVSDSAPVQMSREEFGEFYQCTKRNRVLSLLYKEACRIEGADRDILHLWKAEKEDYDIKECRKTILVNRMLELSNQAGIHPVFFKGYILADTYPEYTMRNSSDTDIYIADAERQSFVDILCGMGYERDVKLDKENVHTYRYVRNDDCWHKIELHFSLFEDFESETIELLKKMNLTNPDTLVQLTCCNMKMWSLGHTEHLIYQIFHMVKHYTYQGIHLRYLVDIALFLKTYAKEVDMEKFWEKMDILGYTRFCRCFFTLCCRFFGLDEESIQLIKDEEDSLTDLLLWDIYECGAKYYGQDIAHYYLVYVACYEKLPVQVKEKEPFCGDTVTYEMVPREYQENELIRRRFQLMKELGLL